MLSDVVVQGSLLSGGSRLVARPQRATSAQQRHAGSFPVCRGNCQAVQGRASGVVCNFIEPAVDEDERFAHVANPGALIGQLTAAGSPAKPLGWVPPSECPDLGCMHCNHPSWDFLGFLGNWSLCCPPNPISLAAIAAAPLTPCTTHAGSPAGSAPQAVHVAESWGGGEPFEARPHNPDFYRRRPESTSTRPQRHCSTTAQHRSGRIG